MNRENTSALLFIKAKRVSVKALYVAALAWLVIILSGSTYAQNSKFRVDYIVKLASVEKQLFHVTAEVKNIKEPQLDISLPVWTPGFYGRGDYAKNITRFKVTDGKGNRIPHTMTRGQTWRVNTKSLNQLQIEFDYRADTFALHQAKISKDFAFFTGTQLFVLFEGHRASSSNVRFEIPQDWKIISALKESPGSNSFTAPDYDTLVDAPALAGKFDATPFEIEGKPHYFVTAPSGAFSKKNTDEFIEKAKKVAAVQSSIFGGLPYDKFVFFYFFNPPEAPGANAVEHSNSYVSIVPPFAVPDLMMRQAAHELFHVWNVKRIRPKEMYPYNYSRENETPLLWMSEGFSVYYAYLTLHRSDLSDNGKLFLDSIADSVKDLESNEERKYVSPSDSSMMAWLGGASYYMQGQILGALLDISIARDTQGTKKLDDVMRILYRDFYQRGRGFSTEDLILVINQLTGEDYHDFFRRYVSGVEDPPYELILGYAGYRLEKQPRKVPTFNMGTNCTRERTEVVRVFPDSVAAQAGLLPGDEILTVDGMDLRRCWGPVRVGLREKIGQKIKMTVKRAGKEMTIEIKVDSYDEIAYRITGLSQPTIEQLRTREAWLKR
jgi:predicted metalloprotease with PDZ domain